MDYDSLVIWVRMYEMCSKIILIYNLIWKKKIHIINMRFDPDGLWFFSHLSTNVWNVF